MAFRAIVAATSECIEIIAPDGALIQMNPAGLSMVGASDEDSVRGLNFLSFIAPEYREQWRKNHKRVCGGESLAWEYEIIGLTGRRLWMETHAVPLPLPDGAVGGYPGNH